MQTHLHSFFVCRDKGCSPFPDTGEEGTASTGKIYSLLLGSQREGKELFLCLLFLNCLQLNIILVVKVKCFGVTYSDPSGWWRRASAVSEIHSLTSVGMMVLQIARGQMPVIKCQNGHGYSTGQLSLMVIIIRPCCKACRILFPWPGIEPGPSAMEAWSLNHWTAREFPWVIIKIASSVFMHVCVCVCSVVSNSLWPHGHDPARLLHGIFQARMLEYIAISCSRGSSWLRDQTLISCISCIGRSLLYQLHHLGSPSIYGGCEFIMMSPGLKQIGNLLDF